MDFKTKTTDELNRLILENRQKLQAFRFAMAGSKQKNVKELSAVKKQIARILTEINSYEKRQ